MSFTFYSGNSQFIEIDGLQDQSTNPPTYVNNATLTATLSDSSGHPIPGATSMPGIYVAASNGVYRFALDPTQFTPGAESGCVLAVQGSEPGGALYSFTTPSNSIKIRKTGLET